MSAAAASSQLALARTSLWLTAEEVMQQTGWSRATFFRRRTELLSRETSQVDGNGRTIREYFDGSLPSSPSLTLQTQLAIVPIPQASLGPLFADVPDVELPRVLLPDPADQADAQMRYDTILPILEYARDPERFRHLRLRDGLPITSKNRLILFVAETRSTSDRTIKSWIKRYREGGFAALADKPRADKGRSRWALQNEGTMELAQIAAFACLNEDLSIQIAWEIIERRAQMFGLPIPGYQTVRRIIARLNPAAVTLSKKGRRTYDEIFAPYIERGYTDVAAGEILVSDHAIHDVFVQNNLFGKKDRQPIRLRFTGLLDMRSRRFTAYAWSEEGSSRSITAVLYHHCLLFGRFRVLYCDNGKDYQRVGKGARGSGWNIEDIPAEAIGVLARLQVDVKYCIPFHPQSKLIERANNTIHQRFDRSFITYCGPKPTMRPDRCTAALERHKKLLAEGRGDESELPLASEFIRAAMVWIETDYNQRTKDIEGMEGLSPLEAWERYRWTEQSAPPEPSILVPLLTDRTTRKIHECAIELAGKRYIATDSASAEQLHDRTGQTVLVAYDQMAMDRIAALDEEGRVFAHLEPQTLLRQSDDEETRDAIGASMQERGHHYKRTRNQLNELARRVQAAGYVPRNDQMLQIGQLPITIDDLVVHRPQGAVLAAVAFVFVEVAMAFLPGGAVHRVLGALGGSK
jgi:hypothetical protein